jgi:hypothetical protein
MKCLRLFFVLCFICSMYNCSISNNTFKNKYPSTIMVDVIVEEGHLENIVKPKETLITEKTKYDLTMTSMSRKIITKRKRNCKLMFFINFTLKNKRLNFELSDCKEFSGEGLDKTSGIVKAKSKRYEQISNSSNKENIIVKENVDSEANFQSVERFVLPANSMLLNIIDKSPSTSIKNYVFQLNFFRNLNEHYIITSTENIGSKDLAEFLIDLLPIISQKKISILNTVPVIFPTLPPKPSPSFELLDLENSSIMLPRLPVKPQTRPFKLRQDSEVQVVSPVLPLYDPKKSTVPQKLPLGPQHDPKASISKNKPLSLEDDSETWEDPLTPLILHNPKSTPIPRLNRYMTAMDEQNNELKNRVYNIGVRAPNNQLRSQKENSSKTKMSENVKPLSDLTNKLKSKKRVDMPAAVNLETLQVSHPTEHKTGKEKLSKSYQGKRPRLILDFKKRYKSAPAAVVRNGLFTEDSDEEKPKGFLKYSKSFQKSIVKKVKKAKEKPVLIDVSRFGFFALYNPENDGEIIYEATRDGLTKYSIWELHRLIVGYAHIININKLMMLDSLTFDNKTKIK